MTRNSRNILLATTMLAGLATSSFDAAQAGPNGPSFSGGSISGFSSMRMDLNRVGGAGRALSRDELRIVPIDAVKKSEKPKDTKTLAKKDTGVARVSKPKSGNAGQGNDNVGNGPNLQVNPTLVGVFTAFGGNTEAIFGLKEMLALIEDGPLVVADPLSPNGNDPFARPSFGSGERWGGANSGEGDTNAPGGPDTSKTGQAAGDAWRPVPERSGSNGYQWWVTEYNKENDQYRVWSTDRTGDQEVDYYAPGRDPVLNLPIESYEHVPIHDDIVITAGEKPSEKEEGEKEKGSGNPKDSQPVEEGSGRGNSNDCGWWGCTSASSSGPSNPRIIPPETEGTAMGRRQSTSWATDPSEEGYTGGTGGGGERGGYDPRDEGCENPDACGGPQS